LKIEIFKKNESTITLQCDHIITRELSNYFAIFSANYRFAPLFKSGVWDGRIRFFSASNNELPIGLIEKVYEFVKKGNYEVECKFERFNSIDRKEFKKFVDTLSITDSEGNPMEPRDYQIEAAYQACTKKILNIHASTASGKSLIIYIIYRFMELQDLKMLLVVPNVNLVTQMYKDFESYGMKNADEKIRQIYAGQEKIFNTSCSISTWQTISSYLKKNANTSILENFDCICVDEAQGSKSTELQKIAKLCTNAQYRYGLSGTYPDHQTADWYSIVGALGPIQTFATYKSLQENNHIAQIKIFPVILDYPKDFKIKVYKEGNKDYNDENDLIYNFEPRTELICKMVQKMEGNILVLFTKKEKHGYPLKSYFDKNLKDKTILYIDGDVDPKIRDNYREIIECRNDVVLLATYATLSAGWSVKNLNNILFASSYKSKIKVLQSIGRGLRLHKDKSFLKLYDIVDNCSFIKKDENIKFINYSMNHYKERYGFYEEQNWIIKSVKIKL